MNIPNWTGDENTVMKGYLMIAHREWNKEHPEEKIPKETLRNLLYALSWATDDCTADEAYRYYQTH